MGLFGSFNPAKAVSRAIGLPDKAIPIVNAVFPALLATQVAAQAVGGVVGSASQSSATRAASGPQELTFPVNVQQPTNYPLQQPLYGGNYVVPQSGSYLSDYGSFYGGGEWGYSTSPMTYSPRTYYPPVSSFYPAQEPTRGGIWEDIINLSPLVFSLL